MAPRRASKTDLKKLRFFRHVPAMGWPANIYWDSLVARITFKDAAGLGRIPGVLGL